MLANADIYEGAFILQTSVVVFVTVREKTHRSHHWDVSTSTHAYIYVSAALSCNSVVLSVGLAVLEQPS